MDAEHPRASLPKPRPKGWCPGARRPMLAADGWLVRIKPWCGRLSPDQAQGLAELARRWAQPQLTLTQRGHVQLRGVSEASLPLLQRGLSELDLLDTDAHAESRRNVLVQPFWQPGDVTHTVADALSVALCGATDWNPPAKMGFAIDTGVRPCLRAASADIRIERLGPRLLVYADGARAGRCVAAAEAASAALELARLFCEGGAARHKRVAAWVRAGGLPDSWQRDAVPETPTWEVKLGAAPVGRLMGVAWGRLPAVTLSALGARGAVRLTPWRALLWEGPQSEIDAPGLVWRDGDPRWRTLVCTGRPGCEHARGTTQDVAEALAPSLPAGVHLHVTGCVKGCAQREPTWTVRVGDAGLEWLGWAAADAPPQKTGLSVREVCALLEELPS
jgi:precorrin-3B synthase